MNENPNLLKKDLDASNDEKIENETILQEEPELIVNANVLPEFTKSVKKEAQTIVIDHRPQNESGPQNEYVIVINNENPRQGHRITVAEAVVNAKSREISIHHRSADEIPIALIELKHQKQDEEKHKNKRRFVVATVNGFSYSQIFQDGNVYQNSINVLPLDEMEKKYHLISRTWSKLKMYEVNSVRYAPVAYFESLGSKKIEVEYAEGNDYKVRPTVILVDKTSLRMDYYQRAIGVPFYTVPQKADRTFYVAEKWLIRMDQYMNVEHPETVAAPLNMFSIVDFNKSQPGPWLSNRFSDKFCEHLPQVTVFYEINQETKKKMFIPPCPVDEQKKKQWIKQFPDYSTVPFFFKSEQSKTDFFNQMCGIVLNAIMENVLTSGFDMDDFFIYQDNASLFQGDAYDGDSTKPDVV